MVGENRLEENLKTENRNGATGFLAQSESASNSGPKENFWSDSSDILISEA